MQQQNISQAYFIEALEGTRKREIIKFTEAGKRSTVEVDEPAGYLVSFPPKGRGDKGHSFRASAKELERLGFSGNHIPLVDMAREGEIVGASPNPIARGKL